MNLGLKPVGLKDSSEVAPQIASPRRLPGPRVPRLLLTGSGQGTAAPPTSGECSPLSEDSGPACARILLLFSH